MKKKILIDGVNADEIRVAVLKGKFLDEFDSENTQKRPQKGNIYLAKIMRIEPSLQAAFVDYGGNRHGFLPFAEIHPDYYRIPVNDRPNEEAVAAPEGEETKANVEEVKDTPEMEKEAVDPTDSDGSADVDDENAEAPAQQSNLHVKYKIQEVIEPRQIILVQVVKEERGTKGAALTTYLSIPGRYCVLMPNAGNRLGGVSRKIGNDDDRKRLKSIIKDISLPTGMSLIVRTAGEGKSEQQIKGDCEYLLKLWGSIRERTLESIAPQMIYEECDLLQRSIRDMSLDDIDEVWIEGDDAFKQASDFMGAVAPDQVKSIKKHQDNKISLFARYQIEEQIDAMMDGRVQLPSGGYLIVHITEALVSIDVNSGRSTKERDISETALKTNLEAANEVARQLRLRDLGGLIVIDFIDMENAQHISQVERRLREALNRDRARIQVGRISSFGLLEMSRQRLRTSINEVNSAPCSHCSGSGVVLSKESIAVRIFRSLESFGLKGRSAHVAVNAPNEAVLFILNSKRNVISQIEQKFDMSIEFRIEEGMGSPYYRIETVTTRKALAAESNRKVDVVAPIRNKGEEYPVSPADISDDKEKPHYKKDHKRHRHHNRSRRGGGGGHHHNHKKDSAAAAPSGGWLKRLFGVGG